MPTLTLPDQSIMHYKQQGQGDNLILISGFSADHSVWNPVLAGLAAKFTVTIFDNRGIGKSLISSDFTIHDMVTDIIALMDHLNISKAHVAGHSMGTKVAMEFAAAYPERLDKLILLNGQATPMDFPLTEIGAITQELIELGVPSSVISRSNSLWAYSEGVCRNKSLYESILARNAEVGKTLSPLALKCKRQVLLTDQSERLNQISAETLVFTGNQDILILPEHSTSLANQIPNTTLVEVDHCAHVPQYDQPKELTRHMLEFLK